MKTAYSFDFDGTITEIPGEDSEIYSTGGQYRSLSPEFVYVNLKNVFQRCLTANEKKSLKAFFETLASDPNNIITIQTRNYRNVVLACLYHYLELPESIIDINRSCFRETLKSKTSSLEDLCDDPTIERVYFFEDTKSYLEDAMLLGPKIRIIDCKKGENCLGVLLSMCPVTDKASLDEFLTAFSSDQIDYESNEPEIDTD